MQNHWILRIQRRLIYAYNDAFDTVIIVDILIVSNIYTGFWGMPCLHWNHTFGKVAIDFGDVFFILKSILYLIFLRVLLWAILWTPGIVFLFLFSLFKTATANGWVVTVPFGHIRCTFPAARSCVWNRIMKLHDGSSKRWRNSSRIWEEDPEEGGGRAPLQKPTQQEWMPETFFKRMGIFFEYLWDIWVP